MALSQILILVVGIIAFTWMIGDVSGAQKVWYVSDKNGKIVDSFTNEQQANSYVKMMKDSNMDFTIQEGTSTQPGGDTHSLLGTGGGGPPITTTKNSVLTNSLKYNNGQTITKVTKDPTTGKYTGYTKDGTTINDMDSAWLQKNKIIDANGNLQSTLIAGTDYPQVLGNDWGPLLGHLGEGLLWAGAVYSIGAIIVGLLPEEYKPMGNAIVTGLAGGVLAGKIVMGGIQQFTPTSFSQGTGWFGMTNAGAWGLGTGVVVAVLIFIMLYKTTSTEVISYDCVPWDAPMKGSDCEKCNNQELPCSVYQCHALGQACDLVNSETTGEQMCIWKDIRDANPPEMKQWEEALLDDYKYTPAKAISPPDRGTKLSYTKSTEGCIPAFTPLSFGIETNEPAKCKLDYVRTKTFDEMKFFFGGSSTFKYNHTQVMSLPGPSSAENLTIQNDGTFEVYTRCMDANGNANTATFVFQFCVDKGPDMTPPVIVTTNLLNNMPITVGTKAVDIQVYTNEPATCKWTHDKDKDYSKMENAMQCSSSVFEMNAQMLYTCKTSLTGLEDLKENVFYFKCKDKPLAQEGDRNEMAEGYKFTLIGTQPLYIEEVKPTNETIKGSTDSIKVTLEAKTSAGFDRGKATCYYSTTGADDDYQMFFYGADSSLDYQHKQDLYLISGSYKYFIKCIDLGGNSDVEEVQFNVETDTTPPMVVRAYHLENYLNLITDEDAECVYDIKDCNYDFASGTPITRVDENNRHYLDWDTDKDYYIKCKDEFGNQPAPNQCSIVVRASKDFESMEA